MKLTVSKVIGNYTQSFDKKPLVSKFGKPYLNAKVEFTEEAGKIAKITKWDNIEVKIGDTFDGKLVEKEFNGKKYFELEINKNDSPVEQHLRAVKLAITRHDMLIKDLLKFREDYMNGKIPSDFSADRVNARLTEIDQLEEDPNDPTKF